jgi:hypothetical protein
VRGGYLVETGSSRRTEEILADLRVHPALGEDLGLGHQDVFDAPGRPRQWHTSNHSDCDQRQRQLQQADTMLQGRNTPEPVTHAGSVVNSSYPKPGSSYSHVLPAPTYFDLSRNHCMYPARERKPKMCQWPMIGSGSKGSLGFSISVIQLCSVLQARSVPFVGYWAKSKSR